MYLSFCNDIEFTTWNAYQENHHIFIETTGFNPEDSFWLFDPNGSEMALFHGSVKEKGKYHDEILNEIKNGNLSVLHSGGNFSKTNTTQIPHRELILEGLAYLSEHAKVPIIFTNHGDEGDIQNIGGRMPYYQQGDDPSSKCYILDALLEHGVKYFWTDINSKNEFVFDPIIADYTSSTPVLEGENPLIERVKTRSNHTILTFNRFRGELKKAPDARSLAWQLSDNHIRALENSIDGRCIIYQHWGVHRTEEGTPYCATSPVFSKEVVDQLEKLGKSNIKLLHTAALLDAVVASAANETTDNKTV